MASTPQQRKANLRLALILLSMVAVFLIGFAFVALALVQEIMRELPAPSTDGLTVALFAPWLQMLLVMLALLLAAAGAEAFGRRRQWPVATWPAAASLPRDRNRPSELGPVLVDGGVAAAEIRAGGLLGRRLPGDAGRPAQSLRRHTCGAYPTARPGRLVDRGDRQR